MIDSEVYSGGGECLPNRYLVSTTLTPGTGGLRLTYFQAKRTESVGHVSVFVKTNSASLTLNRIGIWTVDYAGALALVASTANVTGAYDAAAGTSVSRALSVAFDKLAGQQYAVGLLMVGTTPAGVAASAGSSFSGTPQPNITQPRNVGSVGSQADLGSTYSDASVSVQTSGAFFELLP